MGSSPRFVWRTRCMRKVPPKSNHNLMMMRFPRSTPILIPGLRKYRGCVASQVWRSELKVFSPPRMLKLLLNMAVTASLLATLVAGNWMRHRPRSMRSLPALSLRGVGSDFMLMVGFDLGQIFSRHWLSVLSAAGLAALPFGGLRYVLLVVFKFS